MTGPLISAAELSAYEGDLRLIDVRGQGRDAYGEGHLVGAIFASPDEDLAAPVEDAAAGGRHPLPSLEAWAATLGRWRVSPSTFVVAYDDAGGAHAACRAWWMIRAIGHREVAVLDGGLEAARHAGLEVSTDDVSVSPLGPHPLPESGNWALPTLGIEEVEEHRLDVDKCLIDVRAAPRFRGEEDTFEPIAGHIPGARNLPYPQNLGADGCFLPREELRSLYEGLLDGCAADVAAVYCGSGVTACHTLLALEQAGLEGASLYVGSWSEWSRSGRPKGRVLRSS